jgi:S1-C subfamily serine protease
VKNSVAGTLIAVSFLAGCSTPRPVVLPGGAPHVSVDDAGWQSIFRVGNAYDPFVGTCWALGNGLFATAAHVPADETVLRINGCYADLIYFDGPNDFAILRCRDVHAPALGLNLTPVVGIRARARGFTNGGGRQVQTTGTVSCVAWSDGFVGYDGGIQPGMSGSPVLDDEGRCLGIVSSAYSWHELNPYSAPNPTMGRLVDLSKVALAVASLSPDAPAMALPYPPPPPAPPQAPEESPQ